MPLLIDNLLVYGKHVGSLVADVARSDPDFLRWILEPLACEMLALNAEEIERISEALDEADFDRYEEHKQQSDEIIAGLPWANERPEPPPPLPPDALQLPEPPPLPPELMVSTQTSSVEDHAPGTNGSAKAGALAELSLFDVWTPPPPRVPEFEWTPEQYKALEEIEEWQRDHSRSSSPFLALTGPSGSGKTSLVREIVNRHPEAILTAMTGKAAMRLAQLTERDASTLHSKLYWPPKPGEDLRFTRLRDAPGPLVVVDESSMASPSIYEHLKSWAAGDTKILLVGDSYQLPPVITGKELQQHGEDFSIFQHVSGPALETVMRNAGGVLRAATQVRETGEICEQSDLDEAGNGYEYVRHKSPIEYAVDEYLNDRDDHLLITWRNAIRMQTNRAVRQKLGHEGPLPDEGEPVLIKRNGQGRLNGEIVICSGFTDGPVLGGLRTLWMEVTCGPRLLVSVDGGSEEKGGEWFDGNAPWVRDWKAFHIDLTKAMLPEPAPITWAYCLTCHSAQGSEARRATVFLCRGDERSSHFRKPTTLPDGSTTTMAARWIYTSTTRSTHRTTMIVGR